MENTIGKVITCRAVVVKELGKPLNVENIEVACPQKNEARIKIVAAGVCYSDVMVSSTKLENISKYLKIPYVMGHEGAGFVESVGEGVTSLKPGDKVLTVGIGNCQQCKLCKSKRTNFCEDAWGKPHGKAVYAERSFGYDGMPRFSQNGKPVYHFAGSSAFSEYTVCPVNSCVKVNSKMPLDKACLLACGFSSGYGSAVNAINIEPGDCVAVWGLGGVGLSAVFGCKEKRASRIIGIDINSDKEGIGRKMGITDFINPKNLSRPLQEVIEEMTNGGTDFALACMSIINNDILETAFQSTKPGGTFVYVGYSTPIPFKVNLQKLLYSRKIVGTVLGGFKVKEDLPELAERYLNGTLPLDDFITHTFKLNEINEAFDTLRSGKCIRSIILM